MAVGLLCCPTRRNMDPRTKLTLLADMVGTAAMTLVTMRAPMMGVPMLAGWLMHFLPGSSSCWPMRTSSSTW